MIEPSEQRSRRAFCETTMDGPRRIVMAACAGAIAAFAWAGIISEAFTSFEFSRLAGRTPLMSLLFFYRYFTNQVITLLLCAMTWTTVKVMIAGRALSPKIYASVVVYTAVTALTYELLLRRLWSPEGFWFIRDALMHDVLPASTLLFWIFLAPKRPLGWIDPIIWLIYPTMYCSVTLVVGLYTSSYPYLFLSPDLDGVIGLLIRISALAAAFLVVGSGLVAYSRLSR